MDPTQNQSDAPGPIFSAGASPEESPTPPAGGTSPASSPFSSGSGDIILQPSYSPSSAPRSKKPLIIVGIIILFIIIIMIIMSFIYWPSNFKSDLKEFNQQYEELTKTYSGIIDKATDQIVWAEISNLDSTQHTSMFELGNRISNKHPILVDSDLYSQIKDAVSKASDIAVNIDKRLRYLKIIYDTYLGECIPYIENEKYFGATLPEIDLTVDEVELDETFEKINSQIADFSDFMSSYQDVSYASLVSYQNNNCNEQISSDVCSQSQNILTRNHQTLTSEWAQLVEELKMVMGDIETFNTNEEFGTNELNKLEGILNG